MMLRGCRLKRPAETDRLPNLNPIRCNSGAGSSMVTRSREAGSKCTISSLLKAEWSLLAACRLRFERRTEPSSDLRDRDARRSADLERSHPVRAGDPGIGDGRRGDDPRRVTSPSRGTRALFRALTGCGFIPAREFRLPRPKAKPTVRLARWSNASPLATIPKLSFASGSSAGM